MTYTSLAFCFFVTILYIIYYLIPKKFQWTVLLAGSLFFYVYALGIHSLFILFTIITIYWGGITLHSLSEKTSLTVKLNKEVWSKEEKKLFKKNQQRKQRLVLLLVLVLNFGILAFLKYFGPGIKGLILPLGISFYTFQSTGYLIDVYRENVEAEKNPFKLALFISFFPQIVQGPIGEYDKLQNQLTEGHDISWVNFKLGAQLILWGLFKKLIIADRAVKAITMFTENGGTENFPHEGPFGGTTVLFVVMLYALQLYADFSGGIDISRGVAKLFGIDLAINYRQPYFATTLSDYWRRWHNTLGAWMKKYVFFSLATSSPFLKMGRYFTKSQGKEGSQFIKHFGKVLPTAIATFIVFILVGIWHGSNLKYLAFGIWNGLVLMISMILEPVLISWRNALRIKEESLPYRLFQIIRTFILVLIGYVFDVAVDLKDSFDMIYRCLFNQNISLFLNEWRSLGLYLGDYLIIVYGMAVLFISSILMEKKKINSPGELTENYRGLVQWVLILLCILSILTFGIYGPGYDPAEFVYMQF